MKDMRYFLLIHLIKVIFLTMCQFGQLVKRGGGEGSIKMVMV
jgi:hypothetical protein